MVLVAAGLFVAGAASTVLGGGWSHTRLSQLADGQLALTLDLWTQNDDLVLGVSQDNVVVELHSCRSGTLVEMFPGARVERAGYGPDCRRWASEGLLGYRDAVAAGRAVVVSRPASGITRYSFPDQVSLSYIDLRDDGLPVTARFANGTTTSWEVVAGGPAQPFGDLPSTSAERYATIDPKVAAAPLWVPTVPASIGTFGLDRTFTYRTMPGDYAATYAIWRSPDRGEIQLVVSAGQSSIDAPASLEQLGSDWVMTQVENGGVSQIYAPGLDELRLAVRALRPHWERSLESAQP